jgi:transcription antitermination factor NusG
LSMKILSIYRKNFSFSEKSSKFAAPNRYQCLYSWVDEDLFSEKLEMSATLDNGQVTQESVGNSQCDGVITVITPEKKNTGVSPRYAPRLEYAHEIPQEENCQWYLMRVSYGREQRVAEYLKEQGFIVFHPVEKRTVMIKGVKRTQEESLIPNMLFVYTTEQRLQPLVGHNPFPYFHHFYQPYTDAEGRPVGRGRRPLIVPDCQMWNFINWCQADSENKMLSNTTYRFKNDELVEVTEGPFRGFTGHVVRYKGQTRVGVNINGIGFITTAYIPKWNLRRI